MTNSGKDSAEKMVDPRLRRANSYTSSKPHNSRPPTRNVTISQTEYDDLRQGFREYEALKQALRKGGLDPATLELLLADTNFVDQRRDSTTSFEHGKPSPWSSRFGSLSPGSTRDGKSHGSLSWRSKPSTNGTRNSGESSGYPPSSLHPSHNSRRTGSYEAEFPFDDDVFEEDDNLGSSQLDTNGLGSPDTHVNRTLYMSGLAPNTKFKDLMSVVKGGKILNVYVRSEGSASVTFFEGAAEFLTWTRSNSIYLNRRRIEVKWANNQYRLHDYVRHRVLRGATRNLVVHSANEKGHTEASIRADLEHIHNLEVIDVSFRGGSAWVSTNSVHNALFARTCMLSRTLYKGCKIEFYPDECDVALPVQDEPQKVAATTSVPSKSAPTNLFDLLRIDGEDEEDEESVAPRTELEDGEDDESMDHNAGVRLNGPLKGH